MQLVSINVTAIKSHCQIPLRSRGLSRCLLSPHHIVSLLNRTRLNGH
jgi:hypothetical protein